MKSEQIAIKVNSYNQSAKAIYDNLVVKGDVIDVAEDLVASGNVIVSRNIASGSIVKVVGDFDTRDAEVSINNNEVDNVAANTALKVKWQYNIT